MRTQRDDSAMPRPWTEKELIMKKLKAVMSYYGLIDYTGAYRFCVAMAYNQLPEEERKAALSTSTGEKQGC